MRKEYNKPEMSFSVAADVDIILTSTIVRYDENEQPDNIGSDIFPPMSTNGGAQW